MTKELQGRIKEMIAQGKPQEAVRLLELNTNSPKLQKQIILISSRLETLHQKVGKGIISSPEETLERNIINDALITLVNKHDDGQGFGSRKKFLTVGLLLFALLLLCLLFTTLFHIKRSSLFLILIQVHSNQHLLKQNQSAILPIILPIFSMSSYFPLKN